MLKTVNIERDRSVVIFSSYRTGSTAFCDYISHKYRLLNFDEAFHCAMPWRTVNFLQKESTNKFVIKVMPDQYHSYKSMIDFLIGHWDCVLIRLTRKDLVEQAASWYIASTSGNWHYTDNNVENYSIPIEHDQLLGCVNYIKSQNLALQDFNFNFNAEIEYSDLGHINSKYQVYNKPTNYSTLLEEIRKVI